MADPRDRETARRPLLHGRGVKRALVNVGGAVETAGDMALARALAGALDVRAGERDATLTHPFHAYPARLHPAVARALVAVAEVPRGGTVLDPFCGSGTVLVETQVTGRRAVGRDLSPLAVELARLKTRITTATERRAMTEATRRVARDADAAVHAGRHVRVPRGEAPWFSPAILAEVAALADGVDRETGFVRDALRMLLSSVLVKVSRQASDSDPRRMSRKEVSPGSALRFFAYKARELDGCLAALAGAVPLRTPTVDVGVDDATVLATLGDGVADAVVTSPPYANTYDYVAHHARRYAWLHLDAGRMAAREVGAARWFDVPEAGTLRFRREMASFMGAMGRVLRPGGLCLVVIADGAAGDQPVRADDVLAEVSPGAGMAVVARASQARTAFDSESARVFARRPKREHVVALRRMGSMAGTATPAVKP